ncbi:hypothetical protein [Legionella yabuuchiae]|uniref:hypothetical protein n=1 Tax=Legionella yabuuchiae TaxID=376727 RepID=UPI001055DFD3|nr:hypothetical protein [Legionella yabuuchiae]
MGWLSNVIRWGKRIWRKDSLTAISAYSYQTMHYLFEQGKALPAFTKSFIDHASTRTVANHLFRIAYEDVIPLVLVTYGTDLIHAQCNTYIADEDEQSSATTIFILKSSLHLLETATWIFKVRKQTQLFVRTAIVTLEAPLLFNKNRSSPVMTVCTEAHCSTLRFVQGSLRDIVTYYSTELAISSLRYLPVAGNTLASFLLTYHNGRYLVSVALPEMCNRHQVLYLRQHSELAFSLGIGHAISSRTVNFLLEVLTKIPASYYASSVEQLIFIFHMNVAAHLTLPNPPKALTRTIRDPIHLFQSTIGFVFDALLVGLKTKIPSLLPNQQPGGLIQTIKRAPWREIRNIHLWITSNSNARIFLPKLLHDLPSFLNDPIIKSNWPALQQSMLSLLNTIESLNQSRTIRWLSYTPNVTSRLNETMTGTPRLITTVALQLFTDPEFMRFATRLKNQLEELQMQSSFRLIPEEDYILVDREERSPTTNSPMAFYSSHRLHGEETESNASSDEWKFVDSEGWVHIEGVNDSTHVHLRPR